MHWGGFLFDEIFFKGYRRVRIERPFFITGLPRSGTTFVHRTLAKDREHFTSFRTWEAILAPSIAERRFWKALAFLDRLIGAPVHRFLKWSVKKLSGDFSAVHTIGLDAEEEDYLALLPAGGCFILVLAFPWNDTLWKLARFTDIDPRRRDVLLRYYYRCLQKHLYVEGGGHKRLLSKNAAFASWIAALQEEMPDARFLLCVRDPVAGFSSQLSSIEGGCSFFGTASSFLFIAEKFKGTFSHTYEQLLHQTLPSTRHLAVIDQEELRTSPKATLLNALDILEECLSEAWKRSLDSAEKKSKDYQTRHQHGSKSNRMAKDSIEPCVLNDYQAILRQRRKQVSTKSNPPST